MIRVLVSLGLALCLFSAMAAEDEGSEAHGYTLSMADKLHSNASIAKDARVSAAANS